MVCKAHPQLVDVEKVKPVFADGNEIIKAPIIARLESLANTGFLRRTFSTLTPDFHRPFPLAPPCPICGADFAVDSVFCCRDKGPAAPSAPLEIGS